MKRKDHDALTLVINVSLRSIRAIIFDEKGQKIFQDWLPVRTSINGSTVEQDPNEWWQLFLQLLQKIFFNNSFSKKITYMTFTSSALCLVMLDKQGNVVGKSIMVSDKRAKKESQFLQKKFPLLFNKNKNWKADPSFMFPKMLWVKKNMPDVWRKTAFFLSANDFFIYKCSGLAVTDTLNAEKFYYDSKKQQYPQQLLSLLQITHETLPQVVHPGTIVGEAQELFRNDTGIAQPITIIVTTYDAICALLGSSTFQEGELNTVCGTCSSYRMIVKSEEHKHHKSNLLIQHLQHENLSLIGASNNLEGGVLEWAKECFYGDSYLKDDDFLYQLMQSEAQESELGANGIVFLPYLLGERMPFEDPDVRGNFFGIERFHSRKDIIRSIFEAISFQSKVMLEEFEENGLHISFVNISGGVSQMPFAMQLRADILGMPVHVLSEVETTGVGAFLLTLQARSKIPTLKESKKFIKIKKKYLPNMHNHNCYSQLFLFYKQLYAKNKELFTIRKEIYQKIGHYRKKVVENL